MNADLESARDDLAFMRGLLTDSKQFQIAGGELFFWAGLLYGLQCVGHVLDAFHLIALNPLGYIALGFGPSVIFIAIVCYVAWKQRGKQPSGPAARALNAVFQGAGLANLVLACVFGFGVYKTHNFTLWLYHPIVVCMFQGVAWYVAWAIRKHIWLAAVSAGWFAATIACGFFIDQIGYLLLTLSAALLLCMALPGYVMMRQAAKAD